MHTPHSRRRSRSTPSATDGSPNAPHSSSSQDESKHTGSSLTYRGRGRSGTHLEIEGGPEPRLGFPPEDGKHLSERDHQWVPPDELEAAREQDSPRCDVEGNDALEEIMNPEVGSVHSEDPPERQVPWPGANFELSSVLSGSVYLWACGERGDEDGPRPENWRPELCAAWVVLLTQAVCYIGLWVISGNRPPGEGADDDDTDGSTGYSILAVAGAMYLLLSIAAADLWGCCALLREIREESSHEPLRSWFWWRKAFGLGLLVTFLTLIGASIRVLFFSSYENVEFVIGAAAVLFIADVDEKAWGVLKNVTARWRLFWVIEIVGLSVLLAVFAIKVTGNASSVTADDADRWSFLCENGSFGCDLYSWEFIVHVHPITVTACALLVTTVVSTDLVKRGGLLLAWALFPGVLAAWTAVYIRKTRSSQFGIYFTIEAALFVTRPFLFTFVAFCLDRDLKRHFREAEEGFRREAINVSRRKCLLVGGLLVIVYGIFCTFRDLAGLSDFQHWFTGKINEVFNALLGVILDAWLLSSILLTIPRPADSPSAPCNFEAGLFSIGRSYAARIRTVVCGCFSSASRPASEDFKWKRLNWFVLGVALNDLAGLRWAEFLQSQYETQTEEYFEPLRQLVHLVWSLALGTLLLGERAGTYGVGFWAATFRFLSFSYYCGGIWATVWYSGTVK